MHLPRRTCKMFILLQLGQKRSCNVTKRSKLSDMKQEEIQMYKTDAIRNTNLPETRSHKYTKKIQSKHNEIQMINKR